MALLDEGIIKSTVQETCNSLLEEYEDQLKRIKIALFKEVINAKIKMERLHKESISATDEKKQFAVAQFAALYGFILNHNLYEEYSCWLSMDDNGDK